MRVDRLISRLLFELVDLEVGDRNDARQLCHLVEEGTQVVEVAVDLDLDRLCHNRCPAAYRPAARNAMTIIRESLAVSCRP